MSALFNFDSLLVLICLFICLSTYLGRIWPSKIKSFNSGFSGLIRNSYIIGERLSPFVSVFCIGLAIKNFLR